MACEHFAAVHDTCLSSIVIIFFNKFLLQHQWLSDLRAKMKTANASGELYNEDELDGEVNTEQLLWPQVNF